MTYAGAALAIIAALLLTWRRGVIHGYRRGLARGHEIAGESYDPVLASYENRDQANKELHAANERTIGARDELIAAQERLLNAFREQDTLRDATRREPSPN